MLPQRVRGAVIRTKNRSANGPLRVQSNEFMRRQINDRYMARSRMCLICYGKLRVFCNVMVCVKHRGYDCILQSARLCAVNQGGTADNVYSSLTDQFICQGLFIILTEIPEVQYEIFTRIR